MLADERNFTARQGIDQTRLADVRWTGDRDHESVAESLATAIGIPLALGDHAPRTAPPAGGTCTIPVTLANPPSGSPTGQGYERDPAAVAVATRQLGAYLHTWCTEGGAAAFVYLDPQWRGDPPAVVGDPRLISGAVEIYAMTPTTDGYTGFVDLTLHFSGDAQAWRDGINSRFVTLRKVAGVPGDYAINLNTGP